MTLGGEGERFHHADALGIGRAQVRDRYGYGSPRHLGDGAPMWNDQLLMARRLVEAGCAVRHGRVWLLGHARRQLQVSEKQLPLFDHGISALVEDIYARGLDGDVTVFVWGEFGRTPKINKDAGRDHWARVNSALLAGGGMKIGQVIGATDKLAPRQSTDRFTSATSWRRSTTISASTRTASFATRRTVP